MQRTAANCKMNKKIKTLTVVHCVGHLGKFSVPSIWVFPSLYLSKWRLSRTSSDRRDVPVFAFCFFVLLAPVFLLSARKW